MANTATALAKIPVSFLDGVRGYQDVTPVVCQFDTLSSPLVIYTPNQYNCAAIVGMVYEEVSAHNLKFATGTTSLVTLERGSGSGIAMPIGYGLFIVGLVGQNLSLEITGNLVTSMLVYVAEFSAINFSGR